MSTVYLLNKKMIMGNQSVCNIQCVCEKRLFCKYPWTWENAPRHMNDMWKSCQVSEVEATRVIVWVGKFQWFGACFSFSVFWARVRTSVKVIRQIEIVHTHTNTHTSTHARALVCFMRVLGLRREWWGQADTKREKEYARKRERWREREREREWKRSKL